MHPLHTRRSFGAEYANGMLIVLWMQINRQKSSRLIEAGRHVREPA